MKFRIEKGISVYCRNVRGQWSIGSWSNIITEKPVEFDLRDVWFTPAHSPIKDAYTRHAIGEPDDFRKRINNAYYMVHYYGFHLPENKYNVEQIVVPKQLVTVVEDPAEVSHISEQKKLERKVKMARGNYSFAGNYFTR